MISSAGYRRFGHCQSIAKGTAAGLDHRRLPLFIGKELGQLQGTAGFGLCLREGPTGQEASRGGQDQVGVVGPPRHLFGLGPTPGEHEQADVGLQAGRVIRSLAGASA